MQHLTLVVNAFRLKSLFKQLFKHILEKSSIKSAQPNADQALNGGLSPFCLPVMMQMRRRE